MDRRQLILFFCLSLVVCVLFFALGYIVGRHQAAQPVVAMGGLDNPGNRYVQPPSTQLRSPTTTMDVARELQFFEEVGRNYRESPSTTVPRLQSSALTASTTLPPAATAAAPPAGNPAAATLPPPIESPAMKSASPAPAAVRVPGFRVQVAAFRTDAEAQQLAAKLKERGFEAVVDPPSYDSFYHVQLGDFEDRAKAQEMLLKLRQAGFQPILKRR